MNITPFQIYLVMSADDISHALFAFCLLSCASLIMSVVSTLLFYDDFGDEGRIYLKKFRVYSFICAIVFSVAATLFPDTKTLATMYVAPAIVNSNVIQKDVPEIYNIALERLKESISGPQKAEK